MRRTSAAFEHTATWLSKIPPDNYYSNAIMTSFYFISFILILVVKPRTLRKVNLITVLAKNPMERRQWREYQFYMLEENPRNYPKENPCTQVGTENPIYMVPPVSFDAGPGGERRPLYKIRSTYPFSRAFRICMVHLNWTSVILFFTLTAMPGNSTLVGTASPESNCEGLLW